MLPRVDFYGGKIDHKAWMKQNKLIQNCYIVCVSTIPVLDLLLVILDAVSRPRDIISIIFIFVCFIQAVGYLIVTLSLIKKLKLYFSRYSRQINSLTCAMILSSFALLCLITRYALELIQPPFDFLN